MKLLPSELSDHLASGVTTLCWCWRLMRKDGAVFAFTDHHRDLSFSNTLFRASSGMTATDIEASIGLGVDNLDVMSRLSDDMMSEKELSAGLFDGADIDVYRVNWKAPSQRVLMRSGSVGEVTRGDTAFKAEIRGLSHELQQERGRLYQYQCDADLGDQRCGVNVASPTFRGDGVVAEASSQRRFVVTGLNDFSAGFFGGGLLTWNSGANAGRRVEVRRHVNGADGVEIYPWHAPSEPVVAGDTFQVTAGCDRRLDTCRNRFSNAVNFRGFPFMPGNNVLTQVATRSGGNT